MAVALAAVAIIADETGNPVVVEPAANLITFVIHRQAAITAARTNDNADTTRLSRRIDNQRWLVLRLIPFCPRRAFGPQQFRFRLRGRASQAENKERTTTDQLPDGFHALMLSI